MPEPSEEARALCEQISGAEARYWHSHHGNECEDCDAIEAALSAARADERELDCKTLCLYCRDGLPVRPSSGGRQYLSADAEPCQLWEHPTETAFAWCEASPIRSRGEGGA